MMMRSAYRLIGLAKRYGAEAAEADCARALDVDVINSPRSSRCSRTPPRRPRRRAASPRRPAAAAADSPGTRPNTHRDRGAPASRARRRPALRPAVRAARWPDTATGPDLPAHLCSPPGTTPLPSAATASFPIPPFLFHLCLFYSREEKERKASAMPTRYAPDAGQALPHGPLTGQPPSKAAGLRRCKQPGAAPSCPRGRTRRAPPVLQPGVLTQVANDNAPPRVPPRASRRRAHRPGRRRAAGWTAPAAHPRRRPSAPPLPSWPPPTTARSPRRLPLLTLPAARPRPKPLSPSPGPTRLPRPPRQPPRDARPRHDTQAALEAADQARATLRPPTPAHRLTANTPAPRSPKSASKPTPLTPPPAARPARGTARDAALADAARARHHADTEISRARQAEADDRAENDYVSADAARERDAQAAACTAQLAAVQDLAGTWRARAEHAEHQLDLERDHQRRSRSRTPPHPPATATPATVHPPPRSPPGQPLPRPPPATALTPTAGRGHHRLARQPRPAPARLPRKDHPCHH